MMSKQFVLLLFLSVLLLSQNYVFGMLLDSDLRRSSFDSNMRDDEFSLRVANRGKSPMRKIIDPETLKKRQKNNCFKTVPEKFDEKLKAFVETSISEGKFGGIIFMDMRGFTPFCKRYKDSEFYFKYESINERVSLYTFMDYYHTLIRLIIEGRGGVVQNTMGDGVFGYFSKEKFGITEACDRAVQCAVIIARELRLFKTREIGEKTWESVEAGYGMDVGFFDTVTRNGIKLFDVGNDANRASRCESMTKYRWKYKSGPERFPILVTLDFYKALSFQLQELLGYDIDPKLKGLDFCLLRGCTYSDIERTWKYGTVAVLSDENLKPELDDRWDGEKDSGRIPEKFMFLVKKEKAKREKQKEIDFVDFDSFDDFEDVEDVKLPVLRINGKSVPEVNFSQEIVEEKQKKFEQNMRKEKQRRFSNVDGQKKLKKTKEKAFAFPALFSCHSLEPKSI